MITCKFCAEEFEENLNICPFCDTKVLKERSLNSRAFSEKERGLLWFLFSFEGRIPRRQFWGYFIFLIFTATVLGLTLTFSGSTQAEVDRIRVIYSLLLVYPTLAVIAKRLHDFNMTGFLSLLFFVPFSLILLVIAGCIKSTPTANKYGDPVDY